MYDKFKPENFGRVGLEHAKALQACMDEQRWDKFGSECINRHLTGMAIILADTLQQEDLFQNRESLKVLHNMQIYSLPMQHCLALINKNPVVNIVLQEALENTKISQWVESIISDLMLFALWTIWEGGDGKTVRKYVAKKTLKSLLRIKSEIGVDGILTRYERSIVAFNKIREVIFVPKYNELVSKKTYSDSINSFNTIQWK